MSARSFSVIDGAETATPGRLIPLWLRSRPPCTTRARTRGADDVEDDEIDQPIVHEDAVADVHVVRERLVRDRDIAGRRIAFGREHDVVAGLELERLGEIADADARALEIAEDRDGARELTSASDRTSAIVAACSSCVPCEN